MIQKLLITPKKLLAFILVIISIIGYGYVAFALFTPGETLDPVVSNPLGCTGPTDPNCIISQAWEQDLTNGYVFNDESNVGIGTATPAFGLDIEDATLQATFNNSVNTSTVVEVSNDINGIGLKGFAAGFIDASTGGIASVFAGDATPTGGEAVQIGLAYQNIAVPTLVRQFTAEPTRLYMQHDNGVGGERLFIIDDTKFVFGATDADALDNNGDTIFTIEHTGNVIATRGIRIGNNSDSNEIDDASNGVSTTALFIGNEQITTSVSDERLKTNITAPNNSALDFVGQFDVVSFDWLSNNPRSELGRIPFGLLAQSVDEFAPQYISKTSNPDDTIAVRFGDIVPVLIKAIQELREQINERALSLIDNLQDIIVRSVVADDITARNELCIDDICITKDDLRSLLDQDILQDISDNPYESDSSEDIDDDLNMTTETDDGLEEMVEVLDQEESSETPDTPSTTSVDTTESETTTEDEINLVS